MTNAAALEVMMASSAYLHGANAVAMTIQAVAYFTVAMLVSWQTTLVFMAAAALVLALLYKLVGQAKQAGRNRVRVSAA